ncbi:HNH endonuclease signature motif containing protein [Rossellomorea marisflavi]|uniref:HNH endonuclease signature motif containing protein n=1 Tax=Rossellomorea marisflavi TaxID=189381 RepID=UPI00295EA997|nr:HNH endonuclease signature motif containing protein [Rossellomorea marisflavi]
MNVKKCSVCEKIKNIDEYYYQNKYSNKRGKYLYYNPECKKCTKERADKWRVQPENRESFLKSQKKRNKRFIPQMRESANRRRKEGKHKLWQVNNKEKIKEYNKYRVINKTHAISNEEWEKCKMFFANSCAYCGIEEKEAKITTGNSLHKEHVVHNGSNDITNCVPACKSCNSRKWAFALKDWYNDDNPVFSATRLARINMWLNSFS